MRGSGTSVDRPFALGGRAKALGHGGLDVGAALLGVEGDQHVPGVDLLALLKLDLRDESHHLGGDRNGLEGPHGPDRLAGLDDPAGLHGVDLDYRGTAGTARRAAAARGASGAGSRLRDQLGDVGADHRCLHQKTIPVGVPAAVARCTQHGNDGELTDHTHARSLRPLALWEWLLAQYRPGRPRDRNAHGLV